MISKTVSIDLNNITKGMTATRDLQRAIELGIEDGYNEIMEIANEKLQENLIKYGLSDSMLMYDIRVYRSSGGSVVVALVTDYAQYVEFGTGVRGAEKPHPRPLGWSYNSGYYSSGGKGWWYPKGANDRNTNTFMASDGTILAFTMGMPSRPFLHETWVYLRQIFTQIFRKHINRRIREVSSDY